MIDPAVTARAKHHLEKLPGKGSIVAMVVAPQPDLPKGVVVISVIQETRNHGINGEATSVMRLLEGSEEDLVIAQCSNKTCFFKLTRDNDWIPIRRNAKIIL